MPWFNIHSRYRTNLSAFADGQLSDRGTRALETHLADCATCQRELDGLRAVAAAMRDLPQVDAPRAFALSADQVAQPSGSKPVRPEPVQRWRLAGAALAAALAFVLVIDASDVQLRAGDGGGNETALREDFAALEDANTEASMLAGEAYDSDSNGAPAATAAGRNSDRNDAEDGAPAATGNTGQSAGAAAPTGTPPTDDVPALGITTDSGAADEFDADADAESPVSVDPALKKMADEVAAGNVATSLDDGLSTIRVLEFILAGVLGAAAVVGLGLALRRRT